MKQYAYSDEAFSIYNFASPQECDEWIDLAERAGFDAAPIESGSGAVLDRSVRNNSRVIHDDYALAGLLWARAGLFVPQSLEEWEAIGMNERIRFYRYDKFHQFRWHNDEPYRRSEIEESKLSFMVYLNDDFEGGATDFGDFKVWPQKGMAICFRHKLRHEGATVAKGRKYVLRTDIMYRKSV